MQPFARVLCMFAALVFMLLSSNGEVLHQNQGCQVGLFAKTKEHAADTQHLLKLEHAQVSAEMCQKSHEKPS